VADIFIKTALRRSHTIVICGHIQQEVLQGSRNQAALKLEQKFAVWPCEAEQPEDFRQAARRQTAQWVMPYSKALMPNA
jgi:hypothetical protein